MRTLTDPTSRLYWKRFAGVLCVLLVFFAGAVEVTHSHPLDRLDHNCSLCVAAHSAVQVAVFHVHPETVRMVEAIIDLKPRPRHRFVALTLYVRPPPVDSAVA